MKVEAEVTIEDHVVALKYSANVKETACLKTVLYGTFAFSVLYLIIPRLAADILPATLNSVILWIGLVLQVGLLILVILELWLGRKKTPESWLSSHVDAMLRTGQAIVGRHTLEIDANGLRFSNADRDQRWTWDLVKGVDCSDTQVFINLIDGRQLFLPKRFDGDNDFEEFRLAVWDHIEESKQEAAAATAEMRDATPTGLTWKEESKQKAVATTAKTRDFTPSGLTWKWDDGIGETSSFNVAHLSATHLYFCTGVWTEWGNNKLVERLKTEGPDDVFDHKTKVVPRSEIRKLRYCKAYRAIEIDHGAKTPLLVVDTVGDVHEEMFKSLHRELAPGKLAVPGRLARGNLAKPMAGLFVIVASGICFTIWATFADPNPNNPGLKAGMKNMIDIALAKIGVLGTIAVFSAAAAMFIAWAIYRQKYGKPAVVVPLQGSVPLASVE